jgi:hypothetical protein
MTFVRVTGCLEVGRTRLTLCEACWGVNENVRDGLVNRE